MQKVGQGCWKWMNLGVERVGWSSNSVFAALSRFDLLLATISGVQNVLSTAVTTSLQSMERQLFMPVVILMSCWILVEQHHSKTIVVIEQTACSVPGGELPNRKRGLTPIGSFPVPNQHLLPVPLQFDGIALAQLVTSSRQPSRMKCRSDGAVNSDSPVSFLNKGDWRGS